VPLDRHHPGHDPDQRRAGGQAELRSQLPALRIAVGEPLQVQPHRHHAKTRRSADTARENLVTHAPADGNEPVCASREPPLDGDEEARVHDDGGRVDLDAEAADHGGGVGVVLAAAAEAVGIGEEDEFEEVVFRR